MKLKSRFFIKVNPDVENSKPPSKPIALPRFGYGVSMDELKKIEGGFKSMETNLENLNLGYEILDDELKEIEKSIKRLSIDLINAKMELIPVNPHPKEEEK